MDRTTSPAHEVLRPSSRRLLTFVASVIEHDGGGSVVIWNDQFETAVGSRRVYVSGLAELHALGLLDVKRHPKRHVCAMSERWRNIDTAMHAMRVSADARVRLPITTPTQPAVAASVSAI